MDPEEEIAKPLSPHVSINLGTRQAGIAGQSYAPEEWDEKGLRTQHALFQTPERRPLFNRLTICKWLILAAVVSCLAIAIVTPVLVVRKHKEVVSAPPSSGLVIANLYANSSTPVVVSAPFQLACGSAQLAYTGLPAVPTGRPPPPLALSGSNITNAQTGQLVSIQGVSWPGFEDNSTFLDALWGNSTPAGPQPAAVADFATNLYELQLLGFNAVRLPWKALDLFTLPTASVQYACSSSAQADIVARVTDPNVTTSATPPQPLLNATAVGQASNGLCNAVVPAASTLTRYIWTIHYIVNNGMYVIVDYDPDNHESTIVSNPSLYVSNWYRLWNAIACLSDYNSDIQGRLLIDLLSAPDANGIGWDAGGLFKNNAMPALGDLLLPAMDMLYQIDPDGVLFMIQGGGQLPLGIAPGNGFVTNGTIIQANGLHDSNPFFTSLMGKQYRTQTIVAPQLYGRTVTNNNATGAAEWAKLSESFGYLQQTGYCLNGTCQRMPVLVSEMGSTLTDPVEVQYFADVAEYMNAAGAANDGQHEAFKNWVWWSYPADSTVGGVLVTGGASVDWVKIRYMQQIGLQPWYA